MSTDALQNFALAKLHLAPRCKNMIETLPEGLDYVPSKKATTLAAIDALLAKTHLKPTARSS